MILFWIIGQGTILINTEKQYNFGAQISIENGRKSLNFLIIELKSISQLVNLKAIVLTLLVLISNSSSNIISFATFLKPLSLLFISPIGIFNS